MTTILSWNIQAGLGVDGRVDLVRIARTVRALADADVICMQEVESRGSGGPGDDAASAREDQFETLGDLFPGYTRVIGAGIERAETDAGSMYRFGNLVLSRLPILSVFRHLLPQPAAPGARHMPRQATEVTVRLPSGPVRVVTTHLEYHSLVHRRAPGRAPSRTARRSRGAGTASRPGRRHRSLCAHRAASLGRVLRRLQHGERFGGIRRPAGPVRGWRPESGGRMAGVVPRPPARPDMRRIRIIASGRPGPIVGISSSSPRSCSPACGPCASICAPAPPITSLSSSCLRMVPVTQTTSECALWNTGARRRLRKVRR